MKNSLAIICISLLTLASSANAQLAGFQAAKPSKEARHIYPIDRFSDSSETSIDEGQIEVRFVVKEDGSTTAPMVVRTSNAKFVEPTLRALKNSSYTPATVNGQAVASTLTKTFIYEATAADLRNSRGAAASFANTRDNGVPDGYQSFYDQFTKEMEKENPSEEVTANMLQRMIELKHQSFYSLAYHSLARYRFAEKFQDSEQKIAALSDLTWYDPQVKSKFRILKGDLKDAIWTSLLKEQIQAGHYAEAIQTYAEFSQFRAQSNMPFADAIEQIAALKENDQIVQRAISIEESGFTHMPLLKSSFTFMDVVGDISGLTLRCEAKFAELGYKADAQYELPEKWGTCDLQITGTPGTTSKILLQ